MRITLRLQAFCFCSDVCAFHMLNEKWYHQVGVIRAAHEGCKSWNPPEAQKRLRAASLGRTLRWEAMFWARFSTNLQRKIDLTNAFKSFSRDASAHAREKLRATRLAICCRP